MIYFDYYAIKSIQEDKLAEASRWRARRPLRHRDHRHHQAPDPKSDSDHSPLPPTPEEPRTLPEPAFSVLNGDAASIDTLGLIKFTGGARQVTLIPPVRSSLSDPAGAASPRLQQPGHRDTDTLPRPMPPTIQDHA